LATLSLPSPETRGAGLMKIMVLSVTRDHRRLDIAQRARNQPKPVKQVNDRPGGCLRAGVRD
jgi:hypothetical protein